MSVSGGQVVIRNSTVSNVQVGFFAEGATGTLDATDNTLVGPGATDGQSNGVSYAFGASGAVSGNTISNFRDNDVTLTSCGILIDATAGAVTIGTNDFPDPGNEQDVCDNRP